MAQGFGKQVGKLSIRVLPNAERFKADIQKLVKQCEDKYKVNLDVNADTARFREQMKKAYEEWDGKDVHLKANLDDAKAKAQLDMLARNRMARILVNVDQNKLKKFANSVTDLTRRISGLNVIDKWGKEFREYLMTMDEKTSTVTKLSLAFAQLGSTLTSSLGGLATMATQLGTVLSLAALAPAMLAGAAAGGIGLKLALKDAADQLGELAGGFQAIQPLVSSAFWDGARQPIIDLANNLLPSLTKGMTGVGEALGRQFGTLASSLQKTLTPGIMDSFFKTLTGTMDIATGAVQPLVSAFVKLGQVGQAYLPRLATFLVDAANSFNKWVQEASKSGELNSLIETGIKTLGQLGSIAQSTVGILTGLSDAAKAAGSDGMATFTGALKAFSDALKNPVITAALTQMFAGAQAGMNAVSGALGKFGDAFAGLMPTLGGIFQLAGTAIGTLIKAISKGLEDPTFATNITALFTGILDGMQGLAPVIPVIVGLVGQLARIFGTLASQLGPSLAAFKGTVLPVIQAVLDAVEPLIVVFGEALRNALKVVTPAFQGLAGFIRDNQGAFTVLFGVIAGGVVAFTAISKAITAVKTVMAIMKGIQAGYAAATYGAVGATYAMTAAQKAGLVIQKAVTIAQRLFNLALLANPIGLIIAAIVALVAGLIWFFTQTKLGQAIWAGFMQFLADAWTNIKAVAIVTFTALGVFFTAFWNGIKLAASVVWLAIQAFLMGTWNAIVTVATTVWNAMSTVITTVNNAILAAVTAVIGAVLSVISSVINTIKSVWKAGWNVISSVVSTVLDAIKDYVTTGINNAKNTINSVLNTIKSIWQSGWNTVSSVLSTILGAIKGAVSNGIGAVQTTISNVINTIKGIWSSGWDTLKSVVRTASDAIKGAVSGAVNGVRDSVGQIGNVISTVKGVITGAFSGALSWLADSGRSVIQGFINGIKGMIGAAKSAASNVVSAVRDFFPFSPAKVGPFSGKGWTPYSGKALVQGLADGMKSRIGAVRSAAQQMTEAASGTATVGLEQTGDTLDAAYRDRVRAGVPDYITIQGGVGYNPESIAAQIALKKKQAALAAGLGMVQVR
jgi:phage-related protein